MSLTTGDSLNGTNKSTVLANFEEWIKLATNNKITLNNSWNFNLIDYFYDLNLLRDDQNNINFQKASATLDGCVKIYSNRIDSISNETGKLLSGLSTSNDDDDGKGKKNKKDKDEDELEIDPATGLPIARVNIENKHKRNLNRTVESTLVDFDKVLKLKNLDEISNDYNIDPIFKKNLNDFDDGGAISLLLNSLNVNNNLRIIFDDNIEQFEGDDTQQQDTGINTSIIDTSLSDDQNKNEDISNEIFELGLKFLEFNMINSCHISSSLEKLRESVLDSSKTQDFITGINDNYQNQDNYNFLTENEMNDIVLQDNDDFNDDLDNVNNNSIINDNFLNYEAEEDDDEDEIDAPFDGEAMGNILEPDISMSNADTSVTNVSTTTYNIFDQDVMAYFDETMKRTWRGREHWKVAQVKKNLNLTENGNNKTQDDNDKEQNNNKNKTSRKKKNNKDTSQLIDFLKVDDDLESKIFSTKTSRQIELPQKDRTNENHFLLPDDYHFSSERITSLFIKPKQKIKLFAKAKKYSKSQNNNTNTSMNTTINNNHSMTNYSIEVDLSNIDINTTTNNNLNKDLDDLPLIADEEFWAGNYEKREKIENEDIVTENPPRNPFEDDEDDYMDNNIDFNQAFDDEPLDHQDDGLDTESVMSSKNQQLNIDNKKVSYSRVAKKVDVRRLKENIWEAIHKIVKDKVNTDSNNIVLPFSSITEEIIRMYPTTEAKDLSTSFCFICLLHLANEHGLQLRNTESFTDLQIEVPTNTLKL